MAAIRKTPAPSTKSKAVFITWRSLAAAMVLVLAVAIAIAVYLNWRKSHVVQGMEALVEAFSQRRMIEPRLSGGFKAGEFNPATNDSSGIKQEALARARGFIAEAVAANEPEAHLAYGRLLLSQGEKGADALKHLRIAVERQPESSEAHNDLGACLMWRDQLENAIDEFDLALAFNPNMPEAIFNRALCYRQLELRKPAQQDLSRLAEFERDQGWLDDINRRLEDVSSPIRQSLPQKELIDIFDKAVEIGDVNTAHTILKLNYDRVQMRLYERWAEYLSGDISDAMRVISIIETINRLAGEVKNDRSIASSIEHMRSIKDKDKPAELKLVIQLKEALKSVNAGKHEEALPSLEQVRKAYLARGNLLSYLRACFAIGRCQYLNNNFQASIETLKDILPVFHENGWFFDESRTMLLLGQGYSRTGQDSTALRYFNQSLDIYQKLNEPLAKPFQLMGVSYWRMGDFKTALAQLRRSTDLYLEGDPRPEELAYNYTNIADIYKQTDRYNLTRLFGEQALEIAKLDNNRAAQASSLIAVAHARSKQFDEAYQSLKNAFDYVEKIQGDARIYTEPLVLARAGDIAMLGGDGSRALDYYAKAESLLVGEGSDRILRINALRGRAEAYVKTGKTVEARADLQQAISIIESYRENLKNRYHRVEFLAASQNVFDQIINLDAGEQGLAAHVFEMTEQSRARALLDDISSPPSGRDGKPESTGAATAPAEARPVLLTLAEVQEALPEDLTLLEYSVTSERTYIFIVRRSGFEMVTSPATSGQLQRMVSNYVVDITNRAALSDLSAKAHEIYDLLIGPVEPKIRDSRDLCIVPDKALHFLPFAALKDASNQYLVESHRLTYAPSASVLVECIRQSKAKEAGQEKFLVVGNPQFDRDEFAELRDLSEAAQEARESAKCYIDPEILLGPDATEANVRRALKECDVAHFALHCLVDHQSPWTAALVLASNKPAQKPAPPEGEALRGGATAPADSRRTAAPLVAEKVNFEDPTDGLLYLREVYDLSMPRTRLVVLSACKSGLGQFYRGEGIVSLIHPFIAARVSTVVASLWPVESEATSKLMVGFHRARKATAQGAGEALRAAQLMMIEQDDSHPYYWASFVVVGLDY